jgi:hypothetical protein
MKSAEGRLQWLLFALVFFCCAYFFNGGGWNQNAHFDMVRSLVEQQRLAIDDFSANTADVVFVDGHVHPNKPPGLSLLCAVAYAPLYWIESALGLRASNVRVATINLWLCTVMLCALSAALLAVLLYRYGREHASRRVSIAVALAVTLATPIFPYTTVLFTHVPSALFLFLAFLYARRDRVLAAGAWGGLAAICNYLCIPVLAILALFIRPRRIPLFVAGGVPFAILLALYQKLAFGGVFTTAFERFTPNMVSESAVALGVIEVPSASVAWALLFSRYRGLFFTAPVLLLAFAGAFLMLRKRERVREVVAILASFAVLLLINSAFNGWHGGSAWGPRYLIPIFPFLGVLLFGARTIARPIALALGIFSFLANLIAASVNPMPHMDIKDPLGGYLLPHLLRGHTSITPQGVDEIEPFARHAPGSAAATWASFNLGELVTGTEGLTSLLPLFLILAAGVTLLCRIARTLDLQSAP